MSLKEINEKTSLPFKTVVPIVTLIVMCYGFTIHKLDSIEQGIDKSWKASEQQRWVDKLRAHNPNLNVPTVEDIREGVRDNRTVQLDTPNSTLLFIPKY